MARQLVPEPGPGSRGGGRGRRQGGWTGGGIFLVPRPGSRGAGRALCWGGCPHKQPERVQFPVGDGPGRCAGQPASPGGGQTALRGGHQGVQQAPARAPGSTGGFFDRGTGAGSPGGSPPSWLGGRGFKPRRGRAAGGWVSDRGHGRGRGCGHGCGCGCRSGCGHGCGRGRGCGHGRGCDCGCGHGCGHGSG